jgi:lipoprotein-anchoring transpeptidase ErfK/SrfK
VFKVSTGKAGHVTPTGTYHVIAKNDRAVSSIYHSPMEFALRIGDPGYAGLNIHQEHVPDYPASHGCIRTHFKSALTFFYMTAMKTV